MQKFTNSVEKIAKKFEENRERFANYKLFKNFYKVSFLCITEVVRMPVGNERIVRAIANGIRNEKLVSPAVLKLIFEQALNYAREKFQLDANCESLDELEECLVGLVEKYPAQDALVYGIGKGESLIAGASGVISRRVAKESPKALVEGLGLTEHLKDAENLYDFLEKYKALLVGIGFAKEDEILLKDLGNGEVEVDVSGNCNYMEACLNMEKEGIYDIFGRIPCARILAFAGIAELILNKTFDVEVLEYNPPNCKTKVLEL